MKSTSQGPLAHWEEVLSRIGGELESAADDYERDDSFVEGNYDLLKQHGFFSAAIPTEFGGAGLVHSEVCELLRQLAHRCGSTALACSMHQHLLGAVMWKQRQGKGGEELLRKVVEKQIVLVSTGARDWLESNGEVEKVEGGYLVSAVKHFASQSAGGDVLVTSAPYQDSSAGDGEPDARVLHFSIPFGSDGVQVLDNWKAMGMRGTGSHSVKLEKVFVPDSAISLDRNRGEFHPFWNVILTVALPCIMSVYVGIAQKAAGIALDTVKGNRNRKPYLASALGAMNNELTSAELNWRDMIRIANDLDFEPVDRGGHEILTRKTNVATACIGVVGKAMEIVGGQGFFRSFGLERLFRDVQAAHYHPLQEKDQHLFSGEYLLREREGDFPGDGE